MRAARQFDVPAAPPTPVGKSTVWKAAMRPTKLAHETNLRKTAIEGGEAGECGAEMREGLPPSPPLPGSHSVRQELCLGEARSLEMLVEGVLVSVDLIEH